MIEQFRRFLASTAGKVLAAVLAIGLVCVCVYFVKQYLAGDTPEDAFYDTYVCSETGKSFRHRNVIGEQAPIMSPFSKKNTGYPGEPCYWTKDGKIKKDPTWVILNTFLNKPEPTFCPDCGRLVVGHNPPAETGKRPPPTEEEYKARHESE